MHVAWSRMLHACRKPVPFAACHLSVWVLMTTRQTLQRRALVHLMGEMGALPFFCLRARAC